MRLAYRWGPLLLCKFIKVTDGDGGGGDRGRDPVYLVDGLDKVSIKNNHWRLPRGSAMVLRWGVHS